MPKTNEPKKPAADVVAKTAKPEPLEAPLAPAKMELPGVREDEPPEKPQTFVLKVPITGVEVQEALFSGTAAQYAHRLLSEAIDGAGDATDAGLRTVEAMRRIVVHVRETLRLGRFNVFNWLMMNGVGLPMVCVADATHPEVGAQAPDMEGVVCPKCKASMPMPETPGGEGPKEGDTITCPLCAEVSPLAEWMTAYAPLPVAPGDPFEGERSMETANSVIRDAMLADPELAWSWHCALAMAFVDSWPRDAAGTLPAGVAIVANHAAARFLAQAFVGVDTTTHGGFPTKPLQPFDAGGTNELQSELSRLREAVGLATTLKPSMEMRVNDPVGMMKEIEAHVRETLALAELPDWNGGTALSHALNKLVWKMRTPDGVTTPSIVAEFIIAELADARIGGIEWNDEDGKFVGEDSTTLTPKELAALIRGWIAQKHPTPLALRRIAYADLETIAAWLSTLALGGAAAKTENVDFGAAIAALKDGKRVRRANWPSPTFIFRQVPSAIAAEIVPKMTSLPDSVKAVFIEREAGPSYRNQLAIVDGGSNVFGYTPSTEDALAEDWFILP